MSTNDQRHPRGRGLLIAFEGPDRSGKSTQAKALAGWLGLLEEKDIEIIRFPDRETKTGQIIDQYLKNDIEIPDECIHLVFSANRWETMKTKKILRTLAGGHSVILDRYAFSGVAYGMAKGLSKEWCKNPDRGLPKPDLVVYLDLPEDAAKERPGFGDERYEVTEFQKRVSEAFAELRSDDADNRRNLREAVNWLVVDATQSIRKIIQLIGVEIIKTRGWSCASPLYPLWWDSDDGERKPIELPYSRPLGDVDDDDDVANSTKKT